MAAMPRRPPELSSLVLLLLLAGRAGAEEPVPVPDAPPAAEAEAEAEADESAPAPREAEGESLGDAPPADEAGVYADLQEGLGYRDPEIPFELRVRTILALDYRHYDRRNVRARNARLDRAVIGLEGRLFERLEFRLLGDARGTDVDSGLEEAWISLELLPSWLRVTGGLLRIPLGIEHSIREEQLAFVDYAYPAFLTGRHDLGLRLDGELAGGLFSYDLVYAGGAGFDAFGERRGDPQFSARGVVYPFRWLDLAIDAGPYRIPILSGLFFSAAIACGRDVTSTIDVANSLRNKLIVTPGLRAARRRYWHLGYGWDLGPFRLTHEFARGTLRDVELANGEEEDFENQFSAWAATFSWRITGEPYDSRPYRQRSRAGGYPRAPLGGEEGGIGTLELAVRYANTEFDRRLASLGFTSLTISSQESRTFSAVLTWSPVRVFRLSLQLTRTLADQFPAVFDSHGRDTSLVLRAQLDL